MNNRYEIHTLVDKSGEIGIYSFTDGRIVNGLGLLKVGTRLKSRLPVRILQRSQRSQESNWPENELLQKLKQRKRQVQIQWSESHDLLL